MRKSIIQVAVIILVFVVFAFYRWSCELPYGSDNDEYVLVAQTAMKSGKFSVGDVHGTKYPPFISSLLIFFSLVKLDPPSAMIVANHIFFLSAGIVFFILMRRSYGGWNAVLATLYLISNVVAWSSVHTIMSDTVFMLIIVLALYVSLSFKHWTNREITIAIIIATISTMVRSVGIVVSFPLIATLLFDTKYKNNPLQVIKSLLIFFVPFLALLIYMIYQRQFGPHITGYLETFFLLDSYDASKGIFTVYDLPLRLFHGVVNLIADMAGAIMKPSLNGKLGFAIALVFVTLACTKSKKQAIVSISLIVPYIFIMLLWPYSDERFALPFVAVAAFGIGSIWEYLLKKRAIFMAISISFFLLFIWHTKNVVNYLKNASRYECEQRITMQKDFLDLVNWCNNNIKQDEPIASFDYRELMLRLNRSIVPLSYTADMRKHLLQLYRNKVRWLILSDAIYPLRGQYARSIVKYLEGKVEFAYKNEKFEVYYINEFHP